MIINASQILIFEDDPQDVELIHQAPHAYLPLSRIDAVEAGEQALLYWACQGIVALRLSRVRDDVLCPESR